VNESLSPTAPRAGGRCLLIGYGNELRRDDGVGPAVARLVEGWRREGVETLAVHQLTPELAERLAEVDIVIFLDASLKPPAVCLRRLEPATTWTALGHHAAPAELLALAGALYNRAPTTWLLTIPVADLGAGVGFSLLAREGIPAALGQVRNVLDKIGKQ
jgi:hydrogenase maturation protease